MGNNSFRIEKLILEDRMFKDSELNFYNENGVAEKNYLNIIIGENGVGKTRLIRDIASIFLEISRKKSSGIKKYHIKYIINQDVFDIKKNKGKCIYSKNGEVVNENEVILPNKVLVCSFLIGDNFMFDKNKHDDMYQYLGIRETNARTSTTSITKKIVDGIVLALENKKFISGLGIALDFIGLKKDLELSYKIKSINTYFNGNISITDFKKEINKKLDNRTKSDPFWKKRWEGIAIDYEELDEIVGFSNRISQLIDKKGFLNYRINLSKVDSYDIKKDIKYLNTLIELDLIKAPIVKVNSGDLYELSEGSSGEIHILYLVTSILSNLKDNSLILIDEPELSLHPSWIMKFTNMLIKILDEYSGCHVIITTHSHFILSDLEESISGITILKKDNGKTIIKQYENSTYGWSAENILYEVFGVPSTRNYYLAKEIEDILKEVAFGNEYEVRERILKLKELIPRLKKSDPIIKIILDISSRVD